MIAPYISGRYAMAVTLNQKNLKVNRQRVAGTHTADGVLVKDRPRLALALRIGAAGDWVVIINGGQPMIATDVEVELYLQLQDALKSVKVVGG